MLIVPRQLSPFGTHVVAAQFPERAAAQMNDVSSENLANLQTTARKYIDEISASGLPPKICAEVGEGRGSNMSGIEQSPSPR